MDPYLFENFNTVDGDFLTAKFRAFKFPESTYVQFKGTVNVCLDKCRGVSIIHSQMNEKLVNKTDSFASCIEFISFCFDKTDHCQCLLG